jgi:hypothetical protein
MTKRLSILFVVAVSCFASSQDRFPSATQASTENNCELTQDDYAVFAALLSELHGPEHPAEAWEGKEMLIVDVTATPGKLEGQPRAIWGFRSKSSAAPSQETFSDYADKAHTTCAVGPEFGDPKSYKIIARDEVNNFFRKGVGRGWQDFYKKYLKSAGYWQFSRPGYNSTRDEALLYVVHSCGGRCGTGDLYLLSKQNGQWTVKNRLALWIS